MTDREDLLIRKLLAAGIAPEQLASAAETARSLCAQSGPVEGSGLAPRHHLDFQQLLQELAGKSGA
jgi:hypothetical protein